MKLSLPKLFFGIIFFLVGFLSADALIRATTILETTIVHRLLAGFIVGFIAIFIVPILSRVISKGYREFTDHVAKQVVLSVSSQIDRIQLLRKASKKKNNEKKQEYLNPMLLDTSAVIDGRIANIIKTGFLSGTLLVPRFVLAELQHIADSSDALRRQRGRRGLTILEELKKYRSSSFKYVVFSNEATKAKEVDARLVELAKKYHARIITVDFNLNKVAKVSGIEVLNVNELANSVKTEILPGEELTLLVIQVGKDPTQGVGYLSDGTMIVIEGGNDLVGKTATVLVSRLLQTAAGKMIFAKKI
jgi:uncharacterized protein YacL